MDARKGFTLVEMLVVIVIILILISLLFVGIKGVIQMARYKKTAALVDLLDKACETYKIDFATYPPNNQGGDSRSLHYFLGRNRLVPAQYTETGNNPMVKKPPIIEFKTDVLKDGGGPSGSNPDAPVEVVDAWDQPIVYKSPGTYNPDRIDLWSKGKNGLEELDPMNAKFDDVTNWFKEN